MMTPRAAITGGEVWLRPFGHFAPKHQGFMGFSTAKIRDQFLSQIRDGAVVLIWTRQRGGETGWKGCCRGILQLTKRPALASALSSINGNRLRNDSDSDFSHGVVAVRAWEMDSRDKHLMKTIAPSIWPGQTQHIGHFSMRMKPSELPNIEHLRIREVSVFGQIPVVPGAFGEIKNVF